MFKLTLIAITLTMVFLFSGIKPIESHKVYSKPIALVKLNDMIYHCQSIVKTKCGHTVQCNDMTVHCVTDIQVEYLH